MAVVQWQHWPSCLSWLLLHWHGDEHRNPSYHINPASVSVLVVQWGPAQFSVQISLSAFWTVILDCYIGLCLSIIDP